MMQYNVPLAPYTSLGCGGPAEHFVECSNVDELLATLEAGHPEPVWMLGYGTNSLISDDGLPGLVCLLRGNTIDMHEQEQTAIVEAGVWWDDFIIMLVENGWWGLETTSGIPSSVGGAVYGNIAAYGQAVSDCLLWIDAYDKTTREVIRVEANGLGLTYRRSLLQSSLQHLIVLRAAFKLSRMPAKQIEYQSAIDTAQEIGADLNTLGGRRAAALKAREKAGSLYDPKLPHQPHTAGSFFRNPLVDKETAGRLMSYDETGKNAQQIAAMNRVHGGDSQRVSAAHVLLAAGFKRGQSWGRVRLHPDHVLKIENTGGATASQIFEVVQEIITTVKEKLNIEIEPEVQLLGNFGGNV